MVLVIGFSMAACSDDDDDDGGTPSFEGTWTGSKKNYDLSTGEVTSEDRYTVTIAGDDITISGPAATVTATLEEIEEEENTTNYLLWSRKIIIDGASAGYVSISERDKSKLDLFIHNTPTVTALGGTGYNLSVSDMTK